jgi:hypothetical protein
MPFEAEKWYHVKIAADSESKQFQVHIDGQLMTGTYNSDAATRFPMHATVPPKQAILSAGNGGTVKMWFDDVRVCGIPVQNVYSDELPYSFGTQLLTERGLYAEKFTSAAGCDSTLTINLAVLTPLDVLPAEGTGDMRLFPNPTNGLVTISSELIDLTGSQITVYSVSGRLVTSQRANSGSEFILDISDQPAGMYYIGLGSGIKQRRFIVIKY